ncbi:MAG: hypothetical protein ACTSWC_08725 [Promethearchaeota archaeon]
MPGTQKSKSQSSNSEKDSQKIWITLTTKYSEILDILADDTPDKVRSNRKSVLVEKMIDEYLEKHEKELRDDGKWDKIISVRKRAADKLEKSIQEKIAYIDNYLPNYPELETISEVWQRVKSVEDIESIDKIYSKIEKLREKDSHKLDQILATI